MGETTDLTGKTMMKPYANVVRMHLLIFVFAGLHAAQLSNYAIYPVLFAYFFPCAAFIRTLRHRRIVSIGE